MINKFGSTITALALCTTTACTMVQPRTPGNVPKNAQNDFLSMSSPAAKLYRLANEGERNLIEYSGTTITVPVTEGAKIGQGYSMLSGMLRGQAVETTSTVTTSENLVKYDLDFIDSFESLARSLRLDARASFSGLSGGGSASMSLFRSAKISSTKAYILVRMTVITGADLLPTYSLSKTSIKRLNNGEGLNDFSTTYGDAFIYHLIRGGELYALMEFSQNSDESVEDMRAAIRGTMGSFSASATLSTSIEKISSQRNVKVLYSQSGGNTGRRSAPEPTSTEIKGSAIARTGGVLSLTPDELLGRIREFPEEARANPDNSVTIQADVVDYNATDNHPHNFVFPSKLDVMWALQDLGKTKAVIDEHHHTAESVLSEKVRFTPTDQKTASEIYPYTVYMAEELERMASALVAYPGLTKQLQKVKLPSLEAYKTKKCDSKSEFCTTKDVFKEQGNDENDNKDNACKKDNEVKVALCPPVQPDSTNSRRCLFGETEFKPSPVVGLIDKTRFRTGTARVGSNSAHLRAVQVNVTFPNPFSKAPTVIVTPQGFSAKDRDTLAATIFNVTEHGFSAYVTRVEGNRKDWGADVSLNWFAFLPED